MRQVARWYDADVIYQDKISEHFNANITRNAPVSDLLHYLEGTRHVRFTVANKKNYRHEILEKTITTWDKKNRGVLVTQPGEYLS